MEDSSGPVLATRGFINLHIASEKSGTDWKWRHLGEANFLCCPFDNVGTPDSNNCNMQLNILLHSGLNHENGIYLSCALFFMSSKIKTMYSILLLKILLMCHQDNVLKTANQFICRPAKVCLWIIETLLLCNFQNFVKKKIFIINRKKNLHWMKTEYILAKIKSHC